VGDGFVTEIGFGDSAANGGGVMTPTDKTRIIWVPDERERKGDRDERR
jgi:hypothetical protein